MNNTVYDIDFTRALPQTLKNDESILALGRVIAGELQENIRLSRLNVIYARIDELEEPLLDILAYDFHVDWYDPDSPPEVKREIIKQSVKVHKRLGTKYAVESVVRAYFGSGEVREWWEYGGEPHHFKIISGNPNVTDEQAARFFRILEVVKRKSSWLETILITLTGELYFSMGVVFKEFNRESHIIAPKDYIEQFITLYVNAIHSERSAESHIMGKQDSIGITFTAYARERVREAHAFGNGQIESRHGALLHERVNEKHTMKEE